MKYICIIVLGFISTVSFSQAGVIGSSEYGIDITSSRYRPINGSYRLWYNGQSKLLEVIWPDGTREALNKYVLDPNDDGVYYDQRTFREQAYVSNNFGKKEISVELYEETEAGWQPARLYSYQVVSSTYFVIYEPILDVIGEQPFRTIFFVVRDLTK